VCAQRHRFDLHRTGYVNLGRGAFTHPGDTAEMVANRRVFFDSGAFSPLWDSLSSAVADALPLPGPAPGEGPLVAEPGVGVGTALAAVLESCRSAYGVGTDVSTAALKLAARAHPRLAAVAADTYQRLPLASGSAAVLLNVFSPRNAAEFHRVLRADGQLVVVNPAPEHFGELVAELETVQVAPDKESRVLAALDSRFELRWSRALTWELRLEPAYVEAWLRMGPTGHHLHKPEWAARLARVREPRSVRASVVLSGWTPR
jgi:23S rRNA (guanine745-N1)-methyltransferase